MTHHTKRPSAIIAEMVLELAPTMPMRRNTKSILERLLPKQAAVLIVVFL
jgi:hypothetical protein